MYNSGVKEMVTNWWDKTKQNTNNVKITGVEKIKSSEDYRSAVGKKTCNPPKI